MAKLWQIWLIVLLGQLWGSPQAQSQEAPAEYLVELRQAKIQGHAVANSIVFNGIPYAQPPVAELRWQPPKALEPGAATFDATDYGPVCPQLVGKREWDNNADEDCLSINVAVPQQRAKNASLPVFVWIHGGGMVSGSGKMRERSLALWADNQVILVSFNYRLGMLGFFAHPQLEGHAGVNYGLMDMVAALQWVQDNIAQFGGDPARVTIAGNSAGGLAIQMLMASNQTKGLFRGAISISGYGTWPLPRTTSAGFDTENAYAAGELLATQLTGKSTAQVSRDDLYQLPAESLVKAIEGFYLPIVDGISLPDEPGIVFAQGKQQAVPYISGGNSFDGSIYPYSGVDEHDLLTLLGQQRQSVAPLYQLEQPALAQSGLADLFGDFRYVLAGHWTTANMWRVQQPAYRYWFDFVPANQKAKLPGAPHGSESGFLFNTANHPSLQAMRQYWLNFIKYGDPNGAGLPEWPALEPQRQPWLVIGDEIQVVDKVREAKLHRLEQAYRQRTGLK